MSAFPFGILEGEGTVHSPFLRPTARVILLDEHDQLLLFSATTNDQETGRPFWFPPGGGLDPGESYEEAARREVWEETGLELPALGQCIWLREHDWQFETTWYRSIERYFTARVPGGEILRDRWTELEIQAIRESRWWSFDEILRSPDVFVPRQLPDLLPALLRGELPPAPFAVI